MRKEVMQINWSTETPKNVQKVFKKSSDQFASSVSSYTLQKKSADSKISGKSEKGLRRYRESKMYVEKYCLCKNWIRDISATPGQICPKFWNLDPIFARIMSKEIMQIDWRPIIPKKWQKVCKKSSDQFASSLCSYTLQKMSTES